jgi:hypothetical protein
MTSPPSLTKMGIFSTKANVYRWPINLKSSRFDDYNLLWSRSKRTPFGTPRPMGTRYQRILIIKGITPSTCSARAEPKLLTRDDIPKLWLAWRDRIKDLTGPIPPGLPPWHAINHAIPLIDKSKKLHCWHAKCPDVLHPELMDKLTHYVKMGWWEEHNVPQASPLLCVLKKSGHLQTIIDCQEWNLNTVKDLTPFPDQDLIRHDIACATFRSKLDMSDMYDQIHVEPKHIKCNAFATIIGTFVDTQSRYWLPKI